MLNELATTRLIEVEVVKRLEKLKDDIAASIASHGLTASGATAASLRVVSDKDSVALYGRAFFPALETGSSLWTGRTGVKCSVDEFREIIRAWVQAKSLNFGQAKEQERAIDNITHSIILKGTKQKRSGQRIDVYSTLVDEAVEDINDIIGEVVGAEVNNVIAKWR